MPELEKIQESIPSQEAEVFIGKKGLRTAYEKMLKGKTKKDEVLYFYFHSQEYAEESDLFYHSIQELTKRISTMGIANKEYKKSWFANKSQLLNVRFVDFPTLGNIDILKDMTMLVSWRPSIVGILIHSKEIVDNFRNYFNKVWDKAK